ncbi:putative LOC107384931-like protein, partial [Nothobranchius furzeri]
MKTLCVAVVALSLISACRPSSLACEMLLQPMDQDPEVLGRWYVIALSSNYCWVASMFNTVLAPSIQLDVTSAGKPHYYDVNFTLKVSEFCDSKSIQFFQKSNMAVEVRSIDDVPKTQKGAIISSRCQDCLVIREDGLVNMVALLSKRPNVTSAEMKEFEVQADCLGMYRPQVLNADFDLENC